MDVTVFEIMPHPRHPGDWLLKPCRGAPYGLWLVGKVRRIHTGVRLAPYGLWYGNLDYAIHYAERVAQDCENAEIRVYKRGGTLKERRIMKGDSGPRELSACS